MMLTFFTIPKPFRGHTAIIQRNAITSWTRLALDSEIILFGDEEGTAEICRELGLRHIPQIERSEYGTPLLNSIFATAEAQARGQHLAYVNADIILLSDFAAAFARIPFRPFLFVGQRWDLDLTEPLDFTSHDWERSLRSRTLADGVLHSPEGIDYFVFRRGLWMNMPPFAIGRTAWDNWLIYRARERDAAVIDATPVVMAIHQNHDYGHIPKGEEGLWKGPESQKNRELAGGENHFFTLLDANYLLTSKGLVKPDTPEHRQRAEYTWRMMHPNVARTSRLVKLPKQLVSDAVRRTRRLVNF